MTDALATHYARALADAVFAPNSGLPPQDAVQQLREAVSLIAGSKDLERAMLSPAVMKTRKAAVISKLADSLGSASHYPQFSARGHLAPPNRGTGRHAAGIRNGGG